MRGTLSSNLNPYGAISPWVQSSVRDIGKSLISDTNGTIAASHKSIADVLGQPYIFIAYRLRGSNSYGRLIDTSVDTTSLVVIMALICKLAVMG